MMNLRTKIKRMLARRKTNVDIKITIEEKGKEEFTMFAEDYSSLPEHIQNALCGVGRKMIFIYADKTFEKCIGNVLIQRIKPEGV